VLARLEQRELGLELLEARAAGALLGAGLDTQRGQLDRAPLRPRRDGRGQRACLLEAHRNAVTHRARGERTPGDRVVALAALRQRQLGLLAPGRDELHLTLDQLARIAHSPGAASLAASRSRRTRSCSRVSVQRASSDWRSRRSCSSAASAWA